MPNYRARGRLRAPTWTALAVLASVAAAGTPALAVPAAPLAVPAVPAALAGVAPAAVSEVTGLNVNLKYGFGGPYNPSGEPSIQLDPATRTSWSYGPGATQIQQFSD